MRKGLVALVLAANVVVGVTALNWASGALRDRDPEPSGASGWADLDAQARCERAGDMVRRPNPWPTICRWREDGETLRGTSFPPPAGDPPWDRPRIEIYVAGTESQEEVAHTIAHELGHMHHTREATFAAQWLMARGLAPDTPATVWTEDYAEVFATLFGPPVAGWEAPTLRPAVDALAALKSRFFAL